jgi:hypothetical protein
VDYRLPSNLITTREIAFLISKTLLACLGVRSYGDRRRGGHDASHGGTGIGPGDELSMLSQASQESVPARATALPTKAASAAQVKGSWSSSKEDARTVGSRVAEACTPPV